MCKSSFESPSFTEFSGTFCSICEIKKIIKTTIPQQQGPLVLNVIFEACLLQVPKKKTSVKSE